MTTRNGLNILTATAVALTYAPVGARAGAGGGPKSIDGPRVP